MYANKNAVIKRNLFTRTKLDETFKRDNYLFMEELLPELLVLEPELLVLEPELRLPLLDMLLVEDPELLLREGELKLLPDEEERVGEE